MASLFELAIVVASAATDVLVLDSCGAAEVVGLILVLMIPLPVDSSAVVSAFWVLVSTLVWATAVLSLIVASVATSVTPKILPIKSPIGLALLASWWTTTFSLLKRGRFKAST